MPMKQLFVIGDPVAHSLSPLLHQTMIDQTGAAYRYDVRTVRPEELPAFVRWAKDGGCAGFNVTMPHKEAILPLLDEVDATAASCGAVTPCASGRDAPSATTPTARAFWTVWQGRAFTRRAGRCCCWAQAARPRP